MTQKRPQTLIRLADAPAGTPRVLCFPFAGGSAQSYYPWGKHSGGRLQLWAVELPGRARRLREPCVDTMDAAVELIVDALQAQENPQPWIFFGHSLGALLAFETCHALQQRGLALPSRLILSGRQGGRRSPCEHLPDFDDQALIDYLHSTDGTPEAVLQHAELLHALIPILRADLSLIRSYRYRHQQALPIPLTVLGGLQDNMTSLEGLSEWQAETTQTFQLKLYPGTHFFVHEYVEEILRLCLQGEEGEEAVRRVG